MSARPITKPLTRAGIFIGVGMGGFIDGIFFHQIFQFHHMLTGRMPKDTVANIQINMVWDGLFHLFTWIITAIGIVLLFRAACVPGILWSARAMWGALFLGWGLFNVIEGLVDHHILHLHHVYEPMGVSHFDYLFLLSGLIFITAGWLAIRSVRSEPIASDPPGGNASSRFSSQTAPPAHVGVNRFGKAGHHPDGPTP